jgi:hypothetical protein
MAVDGPVVSCLLRETKSADLTVIVQLYGSDESRHWAVGGRPSQRARGVDDCSQNRISSKLRPLGSIRFHH